MGHKIERCEKVGWAGLDEPRDEVIKGERVDTLILSNSLVIFNVFVAVGFVNIDVNISTSVDIDIIVKIVINVAVSRYSSSCMFVFHFCTGAYS